MLVFWFIEKLSNLSLLMCFTVQQTAELDVSAIFGIMHRGFVGMDQKAGEGRGCANEFRP